MYRTWKQIDYYASVYCNLLSQESWGDLWSLPFLTGMSGTHVPVPAHHQGPGKIDFCECFKPGYIW